MNEKEQSLLLCFPNHMLKICLFEDNTKIGALTQRWLQKRWCHCDRFTSYDEWKERKLTMSYHLFLIDVMLPGIDGTQIAEKIRLWSDAWIIFLTAKSWLEDKIKWFNNGWDDYITKPFKMEELCLRIDALASRLSSSHYVSFGDLSIDIKNRSVTKGKEDIHLTPTERAVLSLLIAKRPWTATRADIIEEVWWWDQLFEMRRSLDVVIVALRKKIGKDHILTISWVGYRIW